MADFVLPSDMDQPSSAPAPAADNSAPSSSSASAKPFVLPSDMDAPPQGDQASTLTHAAIQPFAGFNQGLASFVGAPFDATNAVARMVGFKGSDEPIMGSQWIKDKILNPIGANPDTVPAKNTTERILRGAGEGVANVLVPEAGLAGLSRAGLAAVAPRTAEALGSALGTASSAPAVAGNAALGAASGIGSAAAQEVVPDQYKGYASLAGGLVGGIAPALVVHGVGAGAGAALDAAKNYAAPLREEGQQALAGAKLNAAASDPVAVRNAIDDGQQQIVPGSQPTTFQMTGDMGLGSLERSVATQNPEVFQQRRADQNAARLDALTSIQPDGDPMSVAKALRSQADSIDQIGADAVNQRTIDAQGATSDLGGVNSPDFYGSQIAGQVQPQADALRATAQQASDAIGGQGSPQAYGAVMRGAALDAKTAANQQRHSIYDAVDPDNNLNIVARPVKDARDALASQLSPLAQPMTGAEAHIHDLIAQMPDVVPFNWLKQLDTHITSARVQEMKNAGESPAWGRLTQLKGAVQDAIDNGVANQIGFERQAVARGEMSPEATAEARLREQWNLDANAVRSNSSGVVARSGTDSGGFPGGGASSGSSSIRTAGQAGGGTRQAPGNPGVPEAPPREPNFDQAAADRLALAKQTHAAYAQAYKQGPVGAMLRTNGYPGQYRIIDGAVPDTVFVRGNKGAETVQSYLRAIGDDQAGRAALSNYAAASLRRAAQNPDGTLDPRRYVGWLSAHREALSALPDLRQRFATASAASEALQRFTPFGANTAPSAIPEMFFHSGPSGGEGVRNLRGLIGDQAAESVLTDYAASRLKASALKPDGTLDPAKVATFQKQHAEALKALPGLGDRFSTAAKATQAIEEAAATRRANIEDFQRGSIGKILGVTDPSEVVKTVGSIFGQRNAVTEMKALAAKAANDPDAKQGLRKAVADFMMGKLVSNTEAATSGRNLLKSDQLQTFVNQNQHALRQVFDANEMASIQAIAADLNRANRSLTAVKIPGQSNTAQDLAGMAKHGEGGGGTSLLAKMIGAGGAGLAAHGPLGGVIGAGGAYGSHVLGGLRQAGMAKVDDLVRDAMLNPDLAKSLMMKAPIRHNTGSEMTLAHQLRRVALLSSATAAGQFGK